MITKEGMISNDTINELNFQNYYNDHLTWEYLICRIWNIQELSQSWAEEKQND